MSGGYPHTPQGYGYGPPPPQSYSAYAPSAPPPSQQPHSTTSSPYGDPSAPYGATSAHYGATSAPYGAPSAPYGASSAPYGASSAPSAPSAPYAAKPQKENKPSSAYPSSPGYGPPQPYGSPPTAQPYGASPTAQPYGAHQPYGAPPTAQPYGAPTTAHPYGTPPPVQPYGGAQPYGAPQPYGGGPFAGLVPSTFPPGTDPSIVACFQMADQDGSGMIDNYELQRALSSYNESFSIRTVHLLMYNFTNSNTRKIGPKEFTALYYSLQSWRSIFERFDRDRSGTIDVGELGEALLSLGFSVSPTVLDLLVSKFDKTGGKRRAIEYDNFIECCLTVKGLTEKFKEKDKAYSGSATFTYESFMLTVLPFLVA